MTAPTIIVAGLGRCGSSLVMQMLDTAGIPTVGNWPAFEDDIIFRLHTLEAQREFYERCMGRAVKLLDPHLRKPPIGLDYRCIFLTRHPREQAKSMLKLNGVPASRHARRAMEQSVRRDTERARLAMTQIGSGRYYNLPFENIIHDPLGCAEALASYLQPPRGRYYDVEAMAKCVRRRPATCLPYMLELELIHHA